MAAMLNSDYVTEAVRMQGQIKRYGRKKSIFSELMRKDWLKDGMGFNWQSVVSNPTLPTNSVVWTPVQKNDGSTNTCVPVANVVPTSDTVKDWSAFQTAFESEDICVLDARMGYNFAEQTVNRRKNFMDTIYDAWAEQDRLQYIANSDYKMVADDDLSMTVGSTEFPLTPATNYANQDLMEEIYNLLNRDNAEQDGGAYSRVDNRPIFVAVMSSETQRQIKRSDPEMRNDIRYAEMGDGKDATLLKPFGIKGVFGGFMHICDDRMPRYDWVDNEWVERPFLSATGDSSDGAPAAEVSDAYNNAEYEDIIFWHPAVVERHMLKPLSTVGADTKFGPYNYAGDIRWLNIPHRTENPDNNIGNWRAVLMAGYRPSLTKFGRILRVNRCKDSLYSYATCAR
jgi:hypothetical protein